MNRSRVVILVVAAVAAIVAALLVRSLLGGGTEKSEAAVQSQAHIATTEVLVAADALPASTPVTPSQVRWQAWPSSSVDSSFITQNNVPDLGKLLNGAVVRAPVVAGEPLTASKMVRADGAGFMAAMLTPGMRAVSINITTESGAGGFVLPNDRVDVILTRQLSQSERIFKAKTILQSVRVLAVDQTFTQDKDQKTVAGAKSATLELTPGQAEMVERAQAMGALSLSLRALGDTNTKAVADSEKPSDGGDVSVIRYGFAQAGAGGKGE